jgi:hypothetical protein
MLFQDDALSSANIFPVCQVLTVALLVLLMAGSYKHKNTLTSSFEIFMSSLLKSCRWFRAY